jgi:3',5'-nucleoside bisphosphate phosphatase
MAAVDFDLQSHSTYSDGALPPAEVVQRAREAGVRLLALTDHDTVDGVDEALAEGERIGVGIVPATELSSVDGDYQDLHILGYGIDPADALLAERLADARADRGRRAERMVERMRGLGWELDASPLDVRRAEGLPIGRPHIAGAVLVHPANAGRLAEEGIDDLGGLFPGYLVPGAAAYVPRSAPDVPGAIAWIHEAGGVAVWAHPLWDLEAVDEAAASVERFETAGLDGVEAFYPTHTAEQTVALADLCDERGLLCTGSSDFHGPEHAEFSRFRAFELHGREPRLGPIAS